MKTLMISEAPLLTLANDTKLKTKPITMITKRLRDSCVQKRLLSIAMGWFS